MLATPKIMLSSNLKKLSNEPVGCGLVIPEEE
jgi:hypothetical protein